MWQTGTMSATGQSSIKLDFSHVPNKPTTNEVIDFITGKLGISMIQVNRIHLRTSSVSCHVDIKEQSIALDIVEKNDGKHTIQCKGVEYPIPITMDDGSTIVKIHDASAQVTNTHIKNHMQRYGDVICVTEGVWSDAFACAGIPNGYRYVRMVIKKQIPSYIHINGETTLATHRGQQHTCRKCDHPVHHGMTCLSNRKLNSQKTNLMDRLKSYADVTTSGIQQKQNTLNTTTTTNTIPVEQPPQPQPGTSGLKFIPIKQTDAMTNDNSTVTETAVNLETNKGYRSRSPSVKRQAEKKLTDFITVESKRWRTRYTKSAEDKIIKGRRQSR